MTDAPPTPAGLVVEADDEDSDYLVADADLDLDPGAADVVVATVGSVEPDGDMHDA